MRRGSWAKPCSTSPGGPKKPNKSETSHGRGWFRTSDLSRVKRGCPRGVGWARTRIAKRNAPLTWSPRIAVDYARLSGIRADRTGFCLRIAVLSVRPWELRRRAGEEAKHDECEKRGDPDRVCPA